MSGEGSSFPLTGAQRDAVAPDAHVWLRASAGTGKTQVLSSRVFRLLLQPGVRPENILCLTFTKAGATEMAERINSKLAAWVRMPGPQLATELKAIGASVDPATQAIARQLFARILDAPSGGLQIVTIHGFCQSLLAAFPLEAGMLPGFRPLDEREQHMLRRAVLSNLVVDADSAGDSAVADAIAALAAALGEQGAEEFLQRCASAEAVMQTVPDYVEGQRIFARRLAGSQLDGPVDAWLTDRCRDDAVDLQSLREIALRLRTWGKRTSVTHADIIDAWLKASPEDRADTLPGLIPCWTNDKGEVRLTEGHAPPEPEYQVVAERLHLWIQPLIAEARLAHWADRYASALGVGKRFAVAYAAAKRLRGVVDFDDLIRQAARLLDDPLAGDWIRYKLDSRIDHVLIDEAQDTNADQWTILRSLTADYFAGLGARDERTRTLFAVGDYKQAIFGFQGTSPRHYEAARVDFDERARQAETLLQDVALTHSFRSTRPVLEFVDRVIAIAGETAFGTDTLIPPHLVTRGDTGAVTLWNPVKIARVRDDEDGEEGWVEDAKRELARKIADQIKDWIADPDYRLADGKRLRAGDVLILVQKRGDLAALLVARLHAAGVSVAGVDRLALGQPLGVQDCMAAIRFVLQPLDDLNLASMLVSPLVGWTQDELMERAIRPPETGLWRWLRAEHPDAAGMDLLRSLLNAADYSTPHRFLEELLGGRFDGRRRLAERLGSEVFDPLDELLNAALLFDAGEGGTLEEFVDWFDRSNSDVKRDQVAQGDEVRVMTVHGAKGLQAPVVILADVTVNPERSSLRSLSFDMDDGRLPLLPIGKQDRVGRLAEAVDKAKEADKEEHRRLMYVALTRAEQRLVITGSLGVQEKEPAPSSWYPLLEQALGELGAVPQEDARWGWRLELSGSAAPPEKAKPAVAGSVQLAEPTWLRSPAPIESVPARPLVPSAASPDDTGSAPVTAAMRAAAERGKLIHSLFERLPAIPPPDRADSARRWLPKTAPHLATQAHEAIVDQVCTVLADPEWRDLFGPASLAEVPIAAVVGGTVVTGRADRLLIEPDRIEVVDFKTGTSVPTDAASVPVPYLRQMAWYVAALEILFPDRPVSAAILYSHSPRLIRLSADDLAAYRPD